MEESIKSKLNIHIQRHNPMTEECHAVYFFMQIRKLIDRLYPKPRGQDGRFPIIRFYADWVVHFEKDRMPNDIRDFFRKLNGGPPFTKQAVLALWYDLAGFEMLRPQLRDFLTSHQIDTAPVDNDPNWTEFRKLLLSILIDQRLVDPAEGIKSFSFKRSTHDVDLEIIYSDGGRSSGSLDRLG